jgi:CTP-dependent riboflavin kinase
MEYVDGQRRRGGRKGGDYQIWHARVEGYDGPAHVMRPGVRGHGRDVLEVWAPVKLRDALSLSDGDPIALRVGA